MLLKPRTVLYQCALEQDIKLFEAGDQTEVGERGLTLRSVITSDARFSILTLHGWAVVVKRY